MSDSVLFPSDGISPSGSHVKARENWFCRMLALSESLNFVELLSLSFSSKGATPVFFFNLLRMCDQNALGLLFNFKHLFQTSFLSVLSLFFLCSLFQCT